MNIHDRAKYITRADQDYKNTLNITHHDTIFQGRCYKRHVVNTKKATLPRMR